MHCVALVVLLCVTFSLCAPPQDKLALEGVVVQRAECRPAVSENYMKLKKYVVITHSYTYTNTETLEIPMKRQIDMTHIEPPEEC